MCRGSARGDGESGRGCDTPDWSLVAADFDAVHVTAAAYLETAGRAIPVDSDTATVLAGWNPDETYWLIDVRPEEAGARWERDGVTDLWEPAG